jgi:hypothetical protein
MHSVAPLARPHSQLLSPAETFSDSSSPSLRGDKVSLQLRGDIILEHVHGQKLNWTRGAVAGYTGATALSTEWQNETFSHWRL